MKKSDTVTISQNETQESECQNIDRVARFLQTLTQRRFFGELKIKIKNGRIQFCETLESHTIENLPDEEGTPDPR